eukprot:TRINITY_DN323_c2_g1_i2.p1 TRINITY_DN323_c2_g1~~TRINITY_DN323_c2_g1_i2.p1  ORF type:complete len:329 (-),score=66.19 TRINITY_DN323_c2_g1_i2:790-1776(-)
MTSISLFVALLLLVTANLRTGQAKIICDVETFVQVGFLYQNCLMKTMQLMTEHFSDPCPLLQKGVKSCIGLTKTCYDERGWQRVVQSSIDKTVLVYEEDKKKDSMGFCHLLNVSIVDDPSFVFEGIPQKLPNELCTIPEEAILIEGVDKCVSNELNQVLSKVTGYHDTLLPPPPTGDTEPDVNMCDAMKDVFKKCALDRLGTCFDDHDVVYHEMTVLESIKVAGTMISEELLRFKNNKTIEDAAGDIEKCSVFKEHNLRLMGRRDLSLYVWIYVSFALLALVIVLLVFGIFAIRLRMAERLRAVIQKKPYEEFAIPETRASESPNQNV